VTLFGTYDEAGDKIAAWFAAGADNLNLVLPPGHPEEELMEFLDVASSGYVRAL
jgi:alkanesulfonate monooxygenase SsuD/methylene tetrahydromethanopterin reductase-like flavin-dependent oxidoreductase (luciferase family)